MHEHDAREDNDDDVEDEEHCEKEGSMGCISKPAEGYTQRTSPTVESCVTCSPCGGGVRPSCGPWVRALLHPAQRPPADRFLGHPSVPPSGRGNQMIICLRIGESPAAESFEDAQQPAFRWCHCYVRSRHASFFARHPRPQPCSTRQRRAAMGQRLLDQNTVEASLTPSIAIVQCALVMHSS